MDQQEVLTEEVATKNTLSNIGDILQRNWKLIVAAIVLISIVGGFVLIGFMVLSKVYGKKFSDKKKKPPKCDHPKTPDKVDSPQHEAKTEGKPMTQKEKINKIDSLIDAIDDESKHQKEVEDRQRVNESEVTTDDVRRIEESTSYEA